MKSSASHICTASTTLTPTVVTVTIKIVIVTINNPVYFSSAKWKDISRPKSYDMNQWNEKPSYPSDITQFINSLDKTPKQISVSWGHSGKLRESEGRAHWIYWVISVVRFYPGILQGWGNGGISQGHNVGVRPWRWENAELKQEPAAQQRRAQIPSQEHGWRQKTGSEKAGPLCILQVPEGQVGKFPGKTVGRKRLLSVGWKRS